MKKLFNTMFGALALVGVSTSVTMAAEADSTYGIPVSQYLNASEEYDLDDLENLVIKDNKEWDSSNPDSPKFEIWDYSNPDKPQFHSYLLVIEISDVSDIENIKLISTEEYNEFNADIKKILI